MSTQEFESQNQQAIDMANRNHQQPKVCASKIPAGARAEAQAQKARELLYVMLKVFGCLLAAVLFLAAEFDPNWKTALCCIGFMTFMCMGSILLDRYCRGAR